MSRNVGPRTRSLGTFVIIHLHYNYWTLSAGRGKRARAYPHCPHSGRQLLSYVKKRRIKISCGGLVMCDSHVNQYNLFCEMCKAMLYSLSGLLNRFSKNLNPSWWTLIFKKVSTKTQLTIHFFFAWHQNGIKMFLESAQTVMLAKKNTSPWLPNWQTK